MKKLLQSIVDYVNKRPKLTDSQKAVKYDVRADLQRKLVDFRQRARQYKESGDPYMSGLNQGRAEIIEAMLDTIYSKW